MPTAIETWYDGIGKVGLGIAGIKAVMAGGKAGVDVNVLPITDEPLLTTPALVLNYGGATIIPGSWERQRHTINAAIWMERAPIDERQAQLLAFVDACLDAFPPHAKAYLVNAALQSLLITDFGAETTGEWNGVEFLVLPFTLEAVVNRSAVYQPA